MFPKDMEVFAELAIKLARLDEKDKQSKLLLDEKDEQISTLKELVALQKELITNLKNTISCRD